jgi:F-type H+-transporting ATPase subunit epsilon
MAHLVLDLFTPAGTIVKKLECDEVTLPLANGEANILVGHEKMLAQIGTGILTAKIGDKFFRFLITHGICKLENDIVTVLSTTSETADKIDLDRAQKALKTAQEKLADSDLSTEDMVKFQRKLDRAEARIRLAYLR